MPLVHFSSLKMLCWLLVWLLRLLLVRGMFDTSFFTMERQSAFTEMNCIDFPKMNTNNINRLGRRYIPGLEKRPSKYYIVIPVSRAVDATIAQNNIISVRRFDRLLPDNDDIVKEHAKLVQDINSMRQLVFVSPLRDNNRDYDESIFHEIIETAPTTTTKPTAYRPLGIKPTKASSVPIMLLGGASQRQIVKKPLSPILSPISLVGTAATPYKHPYPFVTQASSRIPIKICVTPVPIVYSATTTRKPSIWEKLLKTILP